MCRSICIRFSFVAILAVTAVSFCQAQSETGKPALPKKTLKDVFIFSLRGDGQTSGVMSKEQSAALKERIRLIDNLQRTIGGLCVEFPAGVGCTNRIPYICSLETLRKYDSGRLLKLLQRFSTERRILIGQGNRKSLVMSFRILIDDELSLFRKMDGKTLEKFLGDSKAVQRLLSRKLGEFALLIDARRLSRKLYMYSGYILPSRRIWREKKRLQIETWPEPVRKYKISAATGWYYEISSSSREYLHTRFMNAPAFRFSGHVLNNGKIVALTAKEIMHREGNRIVYHIPAVTLAAMQLAVSKYTELIASLNKPRTPGDSTLLPKSIIGIRAQKLVFVFNRSAGIVNVVLAENKLLRHLQERPSRLLAIATLELALLQRRMGQWKTSRQSLRKAVTQLNLENIDFRSDAVVRKQLTFATPFLRPEVALLFLAAEDARRTGREDLAAKWYLLLIERAPVSPYAWESLVRLSLLKGVNPADLNRRKKHLLSFYPCLWGYSQFPPLSTTSSDVVPLGIPLDEIVKTHLPRILEQVAKEVRAHDRWLKQLKIDSNQK